MRAARQSQGTASLQSGLPDEHLYAFQQELGGWFPALKWLIKEFRLKVGYETPDEEAGLRFWMDHYEPKTRNSMDLVPIDPDRWHWPTADQPALPATREELQQARRWPLAEAEKQINRLFELKRRICPETPVLVPLQQLRNHNTPHAFSSEHVQAHLREARRANSVGGTRRGQSLGRVRPKVMSRETRDRLFPASSATGGHAPLTDEQFASRVLDLAIEFDGNAVRSTRLGPQFLSTGTMPQSPPGSPGGAKSSSAPPRRWHEGKSRLDELNLLSFWLQLGDKASLNLLMPATRAEKALDERCSGKHFAEGVLKVFYSRFRYECLDAGVLYRFWLSMPTSVRSAQHVRGMPDQLAFEHLREATRKRAEERAKTGEVGRPSKATDGGKKPWRPSGDPSTTLLESGNSQALALPAKPVKSKGLQILSRPKAKPGALGFLRVLAKKFPKDKALQRMVQQCLESESGDMHIMYDLLNDTDLLKKVQRHQAPPPSAGILDMRPKLENPMSKQKSQGSIEVWLNGDGSRASKTLNLLKTANETTKNINSFLRRQAKAYLKRGARPGAFGPVVPSKNRGEEDLPSMLVVEDLFAQLCRRHGTTEILGRFGNHYLIDQRGAAPGGFFLQQGHGLGGAIADCAARHAACGASSSALGCGAESAVDGNADTGWRPDASSTEFKNGGAWWLADLGRAHGCEGVCLEWSLPRRREVTYETRFALRSDLHLEGGMGSPVVVSYVRDGGPAWNAGVMRGDVLQLGVGGHGDRNFIELPPMDALASMQGPELVGQPAKLIFEGPDKSKNARAMVAAATPQQLHVKLLASKTLKEPSPGGYEPIAEQTLQVVAGKSCPVPGLFVGRWVRLEFANAWPQVDGQALLLSVGVMKVWRLAPPLFRQRFLEALRVVKKPGEMSGGALVKHGRAFWASAAKSTSYNLKINMDVVKRQRKHHDWDGPEEFILEKLCKMMMRDNKEFNSLRSDETRALRERIFAKEEDIRECTFHPRTASNVNPYVYSERERISDRMDASKQTGVKDFVDQLGTNYEVRTYPNYYMVHRRMMLQRAKRDFVQGAFGAAMQKLETHFGVQQIVDRFQCFHKGCGMLLDQDAEVCACSGFYCSTHKPHAVHNCKEMKKILTARAQANKDKEILMRQNGEKPPPEEKFDNKVELGMILEVYALANQILDANKVKQRQKHSLEKLGQSLASFGAVRLLERPFKKRMCEKVVQQRRSRSREGSKTPRLGPKPTRFATKLCCNCPNAHDPSELRFPAGESVQRRMNWVKEAVDEANHKIDVLPGSAAERSKLKKENRPKTPGKQSKPSSQKPRARTPHRARELRSSLEEKAIGTERARGLACEAKAKLSDGDLQGAKIQLQEAWELAGASLAEATDPAFDGNGDHTPNPSGMKPRKYGFGTLSLSEPESEAKTRKSFGHQRPLRDCEREGLQQMRKSVELEARAALEKCKDLEEQVWGASKKQLTTSEARLPISQRQPPPVDVPDLAAGAAARTAPAAVSAADDDAALRRLLREAAEPLEEEKPKKTEMCAEFLEIGLCERGEDCPYAHHPRELSDAPLSWNVDRRYDQIHMASDVGAMRLKAEKARNQNTQKRESEFKAAHDRSVAAVDDVVLEGLIGPPSPAAPTWLKCRRCGSKCLAEAVLCLNCGQPPFVAVPSPEPKPKRTWCADFLDTGRCIMGRDCTFAHHPSQLAK